MKARSVAIVALTIALATLAAPARASDWLQWGGPRRDFTTATLPEAWPEGGPRIVWERPLGDGFSAIVVEGRAVYTMYRRDGREVLMSLDARTGATRWEFAYDVSFSREYSMENGEGPHATPLIAGTRVFAVGSTGRLHALDKDTGKLLWAHDLTNELGGFIRVNGYACSPLAFEQLVVHTVGGQSGAVVAFDQSTGRIVRQSERDRISPSSPILIDVDGDAQLVALLYDRLVGLDPRTGATRWSHPHESDFGLNVSTPVWTPDSTLVVSSASNGDFGPAPSCCSTRTAGWCWPA